MAAAEVNQLVNRLATEKVRLDELRSNIGEIDHVYAMLTGRGMPNE